MKTINYFKTSGSFIIKYLADDLLYEGTINIDDNSLKTDLARYIIDNEENSIFTYKTYQNKIEHNEDILIVKKDINLIFDEVNEKTYYARNFFESDEFKNIADENYLTTDKIYFQFYYKPAEHKIDGTISYRIINGLKKNLLDPSTSYDCEDDYYFFKSIFISKFLKKYDLTDYNIIACVPSHEKSNYNTNSMAIMINEITKNSSYIDGSQLLLRTESIPPQKTQKKRYIETHLSSVKVASSVRDKKIILIDDITTSGSSLKACKKLLLDAGAKSVICFAFSKSS